MSPWKVELLNDVVEEEFDALPTEAKAKVVHISRLIEEFGLPNIGMPYVKHIQGKIWEMRALGKTDQARCLYVTVVAKRVVILRCFIKKTRKLPPRELAVALERAKEVQYEKEHS